MEREPLAQLAIDTQLQAYSHHGFWQCMDTPKDRDLLNALLESGQVPWLTPGSGMLAVEASARAPADLQIEPLPLEGAFVVTARPHIDTRGLFARVFCAATLASHGLESMFVQTNHSLTHARNTIRGLHYQIPPYAETKLIRCVRGSIFDVIVDLRADSPTFLRWHGETLRAADFRMVYVPAGFAHGFLALEDEVEVSYPSSSHYSIRHERGICYDDPALRIDWPLQAQRAIVSEKDRTHAPLTAEFRGIRS